MSKAALQGVTGDFVRLVEPETEADPTAILVQFLVAFGNAVGRTAHFQVEQDLHHTNEYAVLVGDTAKGRKGTSWGHVRARMEAVEPEWAAKCISSGLSSGEGVVHALQQIADDSALGRRLLVVESEFASVLRVLKREGNTLSAILREGWDKARLSVMTRKDPLAVDNSLISLISHITGEELRREFTQVDMANGFGNRILWVCVRRSKKLPHGGHATELDYSGIDTRLRQAIEFARAAGRVEWHPKAMNRWEAAYDALSEGRGGLVGHVTSRSEAHALRLATIYAILDQSRIIRVNHLEAALAVWRYVEDSARYVFGDLIGNRNADRILGLLRASQDGLTRTAINHSFKNHLGATELSDALRLLKELSYADCQAKQTGGRNSEVWFSLESAK